LKDKVTGERLFGRQGNEKTSLRVACKLEKRKTE